VLWTAHEKKLLDSLARAVSAGRIRGPRQAAYAFLAEARRRPGFLGTPRTSDAVERKLWLRARQLGLDWGFREWSRADDRIIDKYVNLAQLRRVRSFRNATRDCQRELNAPGRVASKRPYKRSLGAVHQRLLQRAHERGARHWRFRGWTSAELAIAARYVTAHAWYHKTNLTSDVRSPHSLLRRELNRRGYFRTHSACKAQLQRMYARRAR
jgi:hypothetical protein